MRPRRWSECGSRGRFRKPSPGGSGPPLDRHYDRSPRSAVDSGQVATGNAQCAGSQETRELELSRCWMRPARRAPRWSAERRAVSAETAAAPEARTDGNIRWRGAAPRQCAYRRSASLLLSGGIWKGFRTVAWQNSGAVRVARTRMLYPHPRSGGGGPREAWWRGLLRWSFVVVAEGSSRPAPLPPRSARSPLPATAGRDVGGASRDESYEQTELQRA